MSRALTRGRESLGEFENYGERLYVEGLLEMDRRRKQVHWPSVLVGPASHSERSVCTEPAALHCDI